MGSPHCPTGPLVGLSLPVVAMGSPEDLQVPMGCLWGPYVVLQVPTLT